MSKALRFSSYLREGVSRLVSKQTARIKLRQHDSALFRKQYPDMVINGPWREDTYWGVKNECGFIFGHIVHEMRALRHTPARVLLAGDSASVKPHYAAILGISESDVTVCGLDATADIPWNFEEARPSVGNFDLIVSHSIIEHLIDPYRHVRDLLHMLSPTGTLLLHTVLPGFPYHAYPIDCMRFYPDWFVAVASRNNARVTNAFTSEDHIVYSFGRALPA
jgi:hypothetical protein